MRQALLIGILSLLAGLLYHVGFAHAEPDYEALSIAIRKVEGSASYGIKSVPFSSISEAKAICIRTCRHKYAQWLKSGTKRPYLMYLADRYCPPSADRQGNINWKHNIVRLYKGTL